MAAASRDELSPVSTISGAASRPGMEGTTRSLQRNHVRRHAADMAAKPTVPFNIEFCRRTQAIRDAMGWGQARMAKALSISEDAYKKYETRTPLPHRYVEKFCIITGVTAEQLFDFEVPVSRLPIRKSPDMPNRKRAH
jgi:DNA-binding XRE family transcriptional regulator